MVIKSNDKEFEEVVNLYYENEESVEVVNALTRNQGNTTFFDEDRILRQNEKTYTFHFSGYLDKKYGVPECEDIDWVEVQ